MAAVCEALSKLVDKREDLERKQSAFLHRLRSLQIPLAVLAEASTPESGTVFREVWRLKWDPKIETELTEQSLSGDTEETAALARLREDLAKHGDNAGAIARALAGAVDIDLPALVDEIERALSQAIAKYPRFVSLTEAMAHLQVLTRHLACQHRKATLDDLVEQCFDRACFSLPEAASAPEGDHEDVVDGLRILSEALLDKAVLVQHWACVNDLSPRGDAEPLGKTFLGSFRPKNS